MKRPYGRESELSLALLGPAALTMPPWVDEMGNGKVRGEGILQCGDGI
jgi:hypothetical protein